MARILYIEDDGDLRKLTTMILRRKGHSVISRPDTENADSLADQWRPALVITDHNLGDGKETGLCLALRLSKVGFKVAIYSGNLAASSHGIPFFLKPHSIPVLLDEMDVDAGYKGE